MGVTKSEIFTKEQNEIAKIIKALGHPARIAIIEHLFKIQTCICGDLVAEIGLAQPTISQHLKELKSIGIIKGTIEGTKVCYCIDETNWQNIQNTLQNLFNQKCSSENSCN